MRYKLIKIKINLSLFLVYEITVIVTSTFVAMPNEKAMRSYISKTTGYKFNKSLTNETYRSHSMAEFWNLRWNYYGGKFFRDIGYAPFVEGIITLLFTCKHDTI